MKKFLIVLAALALFQAASLFAQNIPEDRESEYFYYNVPIERIYPYRRGYVIKYRKGTTQMGTTYLPREWFSDSAGKGEIINLNPGPAWPYLAVYYRGGEFSHVRLYLHRNRSHASWGNIPAGVNLDEYFDNIDENYQLEF
ncbi:MAG: hypothetical protein LBD96_06310 [Treponema sp.]|jgi:hypothetical protein|nr:hypothetical protein [Treponema sp.]